MRLWEERQTIGSWGIGRAPISTRESAAIPAPRMVQAGLLSFTQVMYPSVPGLYSKPYTAKHPAPCV